MTKKIKFTSQWVNNNISIELKKKILFNYFTTIFFKNWKQKNNKKTKYHIFIGFKKKGNTIQTPFYKYTREISKNQVITNIYHIKLFRAIIRSLYKILNKNANVVGVPELFMAIIRKTIIEPTEYINHKLGWKLIHATVFVFNSKLFVVSAGSKVGKSTLISSITKKYDCDILSDNYCFIKNNYVRTIEEPMRGGLPSNFKLSFYNRTINGYPNKYEGKIDNFILLKRGKVNTLTATNFNRLNSFINLTNKQEKEGILFLEDTDLIKIKENKISIKGDYSIFELEIAEGLRNINKSIEILKFI